MTLYNHAIDEDDLPLERNPLRKLSHQTRGRADSWPLTAEEFQQLLDACAAPKDYGSTMRAFILFAAFTLMHPGGLYVLEWADIDFKAMRLHGGCDPPRTGTSPAPRARTGAVVRGGAGASVTHPALKQ